MRILPGLVLCLLGCSASLAGEETYRAGVIEFSTTNGDFRKYVPLIHEAAKSNIDILVLPSMESFSSFSSVESSLGDNYDELVKTVSGASKQAGLYIIAHLIEKTRCQGKYEMVRSNLVFGRDGQVVSVYRKPVNAVANCTSPATEIATFMTDFGVQFGLMMEEDLVLLKAEDLKGLKNFVVTGAWPSDIPYLNASQFASSWAFTNGVNIVTSAGAFAGRSGFQGDEADVIIADLIKAGPNGQPIVPPVVSSSKLKVYPEEDLSQYIIRPLDVAASARGYKETVCHDSFCCEFYVKARFEGTQNEMNYGLAAFDGVRRFGKHDIGTQTCAVFACAGLYKRSCTIGSQSNSTKVVFEKISINTNFTSATSQYPLILATDLKIQPNQFRFETKNNQVTSEMLNVENLLSFGILGRDFSRDSERVIYVKEEFLSFNDEMQELFDYLWIRIRILIFVVSIYFLEMM